MRTVEIIPSPSALMQSLRGFGYSPETALADLVDNSIAAGANAIDIEMDWNSGAPRIAILDNGRGMDDEGLVHAMCFGGAGPLAVRHESDLGRYGLGLKTASLSQCRRLTVVSRQEGCTGSLAWDIDDVIERNRWEAIIPDSLPDSVLLERLLARPEGTLVCWERIDTVGGLSGLDKETFFLRVQDIRMHFGMVFHRFVGGDARRVSVTINGRAVHAWDPFQLDHSATIKMGTERLRSSGSIVEVKPYVLPHRDRFANDAEHEAAGGPGGWGERQGFYIYRGKRLVVAGGWLGLGGARAWTREESSRLARIALELPAGLDAEWRIDVRKSQARPPGALRPRLTQIADLCRIKAREVFAWRGNRIGGRSNATVRDDLIWLAESSNGRYRYKVNRDHPAVHAVEATLGGDARLLDALLALVERCVPVERIWLDVSEAEGTTQPMLDKSEMPELAAQLATLIAAMSPDVPVAERAERFIRHLPGGTAALCRAALELLETAS